MNFSRAEGHSNDAIKMQTKKYFYPGKSIFAIDEYARAAGCRSGSDLRFLSLFLWQAVRAFGHVFSQKSKQKTAEIFSRKFLDKNHPAVKKRIICKYLFAFYAK